jgi:hypothetical protein
MPTLGGRAGGQGGGPAGGPSKDRALPTVVGLAYERGPGDRWVPAPSTLVLIQRSDGWASDGGTFPDEIDVNEDLVRRLQLPCVRLERGRLYVSAANGAAVYVPVPVGVGQLLGCVRYARLYLRPASGTL